jgi:hypothetical protein
MFPRVITRIVQRRLGTALPRPGEKHNHFEEELDEGSLFKWKSKTGAVIVIGAVALLLHGLSSEKKWKSFRDGLDQHFQFYG